MPGDRRVRIGARAVIVGTLAALAAGTVHGCGDSDSSLAPVGIISSVGLEQAPILAAMDVEEQVAIDGYEFFVGKTDDVPVISVFAGEKDESVQLAAHLLATRFEPRAILFSGTAGSQSPRINVGDVVVSGFVVDKSNVHYTRGGYREPYTGIEVNTGGKTNLEGAEIAGYDRPLPSPADTKSFRRGPSRPNRQWAYVTAFAAPRALVRLAEAAPSVGRTRAVRATGRTTAKGVITNKLVVGVIGQANTWTEPLSWIAAQNFLYQSDAEENEATGFAFASATQGIPWMLVRGISDTPWHPKAYSGVLASKRAAEVALYVATHLPTEVGKAAVTFDDLSPVSNARRAGYVVADRAFTEIGPVTKVTYTDRRGRKRAIAGSALAKQRRAYTDAASPVLSPGDKDARR